MAMEVCGIPMIKVSERERAEGPLAQFWTRSVQNSRTLLIRTGSFFLKWLYFFCFYLCHRQRNAYNLRTRYRRELRFTAFCRPKPCGVQVFFGFSKMRTRAGRRPKNCFHSTLPNSRTVWPRKFNFAAFCSLTKPSSNRLFRFAQMRERAGRRP